MLHLQVVEATTANGLCTVRVAALPLPAAVASVLDGAGDVLRRSLLVRRDGSRQPVLDSRAAQHAHSSTAEACCSSSNGAAEEAPASQSQHAQPDGAAGTLGSSEGGERMNRDVHAGSVPTNGATVEPGLPEPAGRHRPVSQGADEEADSSGHVYLEADEVAAEAGSELSSLQQRLHAAVAEAGGDAAELLRRAWLLGPKQVGPVTCSQVLPVATPRGS